MRKYVLVLTLLMILLMPVFVLADVGSLPPDAVLTNPLGADNLPAILDKIIGFLLTVAAPVAVVMTIYAAFLFITAGDKPEQIKKARQTLMYVIVGVAVLILSKGIVNLAVSFLKT